MPTKRAIIKKTTKKIAQKTLRGQYHRAVRPKHYTAAALANIKRRWPARDLKVIGVTGTNGKTTTTHLIQRMLTESGYQAGLITSVGYGVGDRIEPQMAHMTLPAIEVLLDRIIDMKTQAGQLDWLVLEVTSQGLSQFRTLGIPIDIAVMTNITHEHIDYHLTFRRYLQSKLRLFKLAAKNKAGRQLGIINSDDSNAPWFIDEVPNVMTYSLRATSEPTVAYPQNLKLTPTGSQFWVKLGDDRYDIKCQLPGLFNVANCLAALLVGRAIGLTPAQVGAGIASLDGVEGRMAAIDEGQKFAVVVDFAHTPDSFEKLFSNLTANPGGRIICLFGSAGRRDRLKRAIQGEIAAQYADTIVLTEEDDRDEDGQEIMDQIAKGAERVGKTHDRDLFLIGDRRKAITFALRQAKPGDTVLLLGKGHEKTIERATETIDWNETEITRQLLRQQLKSSTSRSSAKPPTAKRRPVKPAAKKPA